MPMGHSPCIWHTEHGCIAFPRIIRLQMISSRDVYKIVGDAKLHRQTGLGSSFMQSIPTDLLEHSSDATGAAEVVAGVSGIPALHHLQLVYVCFRVWVPDRASVLQNWPNESLVGPFLDRCWCSAEIPLEEGTIECCWPSWLSG